MNMRRKLSWVVVLVVAGLVASCAGGPTQKDTGSGAPVVNNPAVNGKAVSDPPAGEPEGGCWCGDGKCSCDHCKEKKEGKAKPSKRCDCCG